MSDLDYRIIDRAGKWWVRLGENEAGPFILKVDAVHEAIAVARSMGRNGHRARVWLEEPGGGGEPVFDSRRDE